MANLITDLKRAWRLTKLIRSTELTEEEAFQLEKVDSIYMEECRGIRASLDKARKSLNRNVKTSRVDNDKRLLVLGDSLSNSITSISQLLDASQKTLSNRLGQVEQSSQTTAEMVNDVREYVAKQADETRRWQEGYDWRILKNYLLRVISTMDDIERKLKFYRKSGRGDDFIKDFDFLRETLEIHLEEEGLIVFAPHVGVEPDVSLVEIKASVTISGEGQLAGTVAEVICKGYEMDVGVETKVVRKAQISVYKNKE